MAARVRSNGTVIFWLVVLRTVHTKAAADVQAAVRTTAGTHCAHIEQFPGPGSAAAAISPSRGRLSGHAVFLRGQEGL